MNECNKRNYQSVRIKHRKKAKSHYLFIEMFMQSTNQWRNWRFEPARDAKHAERGPLATVGPTSQHSEKSLTNDGNPVVGGYTNPLNQRKILRKTQKTTTH